MRVRLNVFSGRPDPEWTLGSQPQIELQERLARLLQQSLPQDASIPDHLGYRGIEVLGEGGDAPLAHVYRGTVLFVQQRRAARDATLESWLLDQTADLAPSIRTAVLAAIAP